MMLPEAGQNTVCSTLAQGWESALHIQGKGRGKWRGGWREGNSGESGGQEKRKGRKKRERGRDERGEREEQEKGRREERGMERPQSVMGVGVHLSVIWSTPTEYLHSLLHYWPGFLPALAPLTMKLITAWL